MLEAQPVQRCGLCWSAGLYGRYRFDFTMTTHLRPHEQNITTDPSRRVVAQAKKKAANRAMRSCRPREHHWHPFRIVALVVT